jgi:hypothetical protein
LLHRAKLYRKGKTAPCQNARARIRNTHAPRGAAQGLKVERVSGVVVAAPIKPGDAVTLSYHQAIATQMVSTPQPERDPAPAP